MFRVPPSPSRVCLPRENRTARVPNIAISGVRAVLSLFRTFNPKADSTVRDAAGALGSGPAASLLVHGVTPGEVTGLLMALRAVAPGTSLHQRVRLLSDSMREYGVPVGDLVVGADEFMLILSVIDHGIHLQKIVEEDAGLDTSMAVNELRVTRLRVLNALELSEGLVTV